MSMGHVGVRRVRRDRAHCRGLIVVAALVLFVGLFLQITMLSRISLKSKQAAKLEKEIIELNANAENLEVTINQYHNLENIEARARQMGMQQPDETQIRVISVPQIDAENTSIQQAADAVGGGEVPN